MKKLVFATGNRHKADEVEAILDGFFKIQTMRELGFDGEIEETEPTIEGNSQLKARFLNQKFGIDCFSEDTGLEVFALGGAPGVDTAHYSGSRDAGENIAFLLQNLDGKMDRRAQFRTVITLIFEGNEFQFEGICRGQIALEKRGEKGWGYDPVFMPDGFENSFAELGEVVKNRISHRALATEKLKMFLLEKAKTA